jgi:aspartyl-tRNA(Asn)/glutamyl-tRNA(Gln) amidotransferase subunit A
MTDVTQLTADALLQLYRTGQASPVEVTQQVLNRIARLNPVLNAFCWVDEPAALQSARLSEQRWQAHRHQGATVGALEGVPVSIKDLILTRGWPTLRGSLGGGRTGDGPFARGWRGVAGQNHHARVRLQRRNQFLAHWHQPQPVEP